MTRRRLTANATTSRDSARDLGISSIVAIASENVTSEEGTYGWVRASRNALATRAAGFCVCVGWVRLAVCARARARAACTQRKQVRRAHPEGPAAECTQNDVLHTAIDQGVKNGTRPVDRLSMVVSQPWVA